MAAYIHGSVEVNDPEAYKAYTSQVGDVVAAHGGRFLVRGGPLELLEGTPVRPRQVLIEFPDMASLKAFYDSPAYQRLIPLRQAASTGTLVALTGVA